MWGTFEVRSLRRLCVSSQTIADERYVAQGGGPVLLSKIGHEPHNRHFDFQIELIFGFE